MEKKELIGKKIKGFRFDPKVGKWVYLMDEYIGKIGLIAKYHPITDEYRVKFDDAFWCYPAGEIEKHLVEEASVSDVKYIRRFASGAVRGNNKGRIRPDWISPYAIEEISKVLIENENDFGACNYMLGIPEEKCLESMCRHVLELQEAILVKKDMEEAKIVARSVGFNIVAMLHTMVLKEKGLYKEIYDKEKVITVEEAKKGVNYVNKDGFSKGMGKDSDPKELNHENFKPSSNTTFVDKDVAFSYTANKNQTIDLGDSLYNSDIWPNPFKKPDRFLGVNFSYIKTSCIPFDVRFLEVGDSIENQRGEELNYVGDNSYRYVTIDPSRFLSDWFSKWRKV